MLGSCPDLWGSAAGHIGMGAVRADVPGWVREAEPSGSVLEGNSELRRTGPSATRPEQWWCPRACGRQVAAPGASGAQASPAGLFAGEQGSSGWRVPTLSQTLVTNLATVRALGHAGRQAGVRGTGPPWSI